MESNNVVKLIYSSKNDEDILETRKVLKRYIRDYNKYKEIKVIEDEKEILDIIIKNFKVAITYNFKRLILLLKKRRIESNLMNYGFNSLNLEDKIKEKLTKNDIKMIKYFIKQLDIIDKLLIVLNKIHKEIREYEKLIFKKRKNVLDINDIFRISPDKDLINIESKKSNKNIFDIHDISYNFIGKISEYMENLCDTKNQTLYYSVVAYDYVKDKEDEIELKEGDIIDVEFEGENDWYVGTRIKNCETGIFPGSYLSEKKYSLKDIEDIVF